MSTKMRIFTVGLLATAAIIALVSSYGLFVGGDNRSEAETRTKVKFANLPYADHTYSCIAVEKGWFKEAGLDVELSTIKIDDAVPSLVNGAYDVVSVPPGVLFAAYESTPDVCTFVFGDLFQGYALMAQPDSGLNDYAHFRRNGLDHDAAVSAVASQLKGRKFAYPTENAIKPFIELLLERGNVKESEFTSLVLDDPLTISAMRNGEADFQVGGVPSRITLQKEGFVPLISSIDLAQGAIASAESRELASILQNGWATRKELFKSDRATILRLASVNYRIMKYIETHRDEAIQIHMKYLSRVTGQEFTEADGEIIYDYLDPFVTFEDQWAWFHNADNPLFFEYVNGAILNSFKSDGLYDERAPTVDDVIYADDIYFELEKLREQAMINLRRLEELQSDDLSLEEAVVTVRQFMDAYNFYDAVEYSSSVIADADR